MQQSKKPVCSPKFSVVSHACFVREVMFASVKRAIDKFVFQLFADDWMVLRFTCAAAEDPGSGT